MKKVLFFFSILLFTRHGNAQTLYSFNGGGTSGNWNDLNTWTTDPTGSTSVGARLPQAGDNIVVTNSFVVNVTATEATTGLSITIQRGGTLNFPNAASAFSATLTRLAGQGTLRVGRPYFPTVTTNDFDDAGTGTVEFYDWATSPGTLPVPASKQYNNLRLLNSTGMAYAAQLDGNLTLTGNLVLTRTGSAGIALNLGQTANTARSLTVQGNVTVEAGTSLGVTAVAGAHTLTVNGNFTNSGAVRLHNGNVTGDDTQRSALVFTGTTDAVLACNGPTDLSTLQVNKGVASRAILSVTSTVTSPAGGNLRLNYIGNANLLVITNGTAKLGDNIVLPRLSNSTSNYDIGTSANSAALWVAGATVLNNNAAALVVYGGFRISGGRFECLGGEGAVTREDGQYLIEGGTTVVEKFRPSNTLSTHRGSFTITGGVFECSGTKSDGNYARFAHPYVTQSFRMTGGTIRVQNPQNSSGLFHIGVSPDNAVVMGGTVELLLPATNVNCKVLSTAPLWNLYISKPTGGGTSKAVLDAIGVTSGYESGATITTQPLTVYNNFFINGANPATFDANSQDVNIQGTFTIGSGCTYLPTTNTTRFSGNQNQLLTNNGSIGSTQNTFYNLTVDKSNGTLTLDGSATTFTITNTLSLINGVLNDGSKTVRVLGGLVNSASHTSGGGTGSIMLAGAGGQVVSGNGSGVFGNLVINSTATAGAVAATLTASQSVASVLTLQSNHVLDIGNNLLWLTNISPNALAAGTGGFSSQRMVRTSGNQSDPGLRKTYGGADSFTFPVGVGSKYTPATIALGAALQLYGRVSVSPTNARNPFVTSNNSLAYYWKVRSSDFGPIPANSITASFTMQNADATGTLANYVPGRYLPVSWTTSNNVNQVVKSTSTSVVQFPSLSQFEGEFTAGEPAAFGTVTAYYTTRSGNWEDNNPATTPWSTVSHSGAAASVAPGPGNPVFIGSAADGQFHTVTVTANNARSGSLVIERGSTLDVQTLTGHNFGALPDATASGAGRLRISAATATAEFPGGDFGTFLQASGGTVEYYTTGAQDLTVPTASATSLALATYKNLWLNAAAGQRVSLPTRDLRLFAQLKVGTQSAYSGEVLLSGSTAGNLVADSLVAVQNGALRYANGTARTVTAGSVSIGAGATLDANGSGAAVANALRVGGSLTNDGTLNLNPGSSKTASLTFTGSQAASLTGTTVAATTTLASLLVSKGTNQTPVLTVDVAGTLTTPTSSWLTLSSGTLRYAKPSSMLTIHDAASPYVINDAAGLTVDAPNATVTIATANSAAADLQLAGQLRVLQGILSVGLVATGAGNDLEYASAGAPTVRVGSAGTLYVNGQVRRSTSNTSGALRYDQSGGAVEVGGFGATAANSNERGVFEIQGPGSIFRQTGGTLTLHRSNQNAVLISDLYLRPDSTVVTAGTVVLGNAVAGAGNVTLSIDSAVPLYDLRVEAGANATSQNIGLLTGNNALTLRGSLTIANDNAFFNANGLGLNIGQHLLNSNSSTSTALTDGGFRPSVATQTTTFTGGIAAQQLTAAPGTATNLTVFGNLVLNNAASGGALQLQAARNVRVAGNLTLAQGTLDDNGQTITALGNVTNSAVHTSSGTGSLRLAGTTPQTVDGNGSGRFGNVTLDNPAGATTAANQQVTGVLTLTNGAFTIGSNLLWLSNPSAAAVVAAGTPSTFSDKRCIRTNGIVADLGVRKSYPSGASDFTFPVGVTGKYTPVRLNVTANGAAGTLTVRPINTAHPSTTDPAAKELAYYWKVGSTGFSAPTTTHVYSYVDASAGNDVNGTEANYVLGRFLGSAWTPQNGIGGAVNTTANTLTLANVGYFDGDYTGGESSEFGQVPTFYSSTSGQVNGHTTWNDPQAWTFNDDGSDSSPLPTAFPTLANPVVVLGGHLINANGAGRGAANLLLQGTLDLGANGANNFNTVTGTGTLRIGSALFPAGNYAAFVAASTGGTVDYTAAVQLPARDTYNNLRLSGGTAKQFSNLDLTINGSLTTTAGTTVTNPTSQNLTLTSASSGATLAGSFYLNDGALTTPAFLANSGTLVLGAGGVNVGALANSGTLSNGAGAVAVSTTFSNSGTYNANVGPGGLSVGTMFSNSGSYVAGTGGLAVGSDFSNLAGGTFTAAVGDVGVGGSFANAGTYTATTGNALRVASDFSNALGGSFKAGTSMLRLQGNFTNRGTFTAGTGLVQFLASANRQLNGTTTFYDVQKQGNGDLALGASTDVTVSNVLTLQNGLLTTGTSNTLYLTNTATQPIVGNGNSAYVNGRLAMSLPDAAAASRVFPVGLGGRYRPVTIQPQVASSSPVVLVEIFNGAPGGTVDNSLSNLSANRYYRIQLQSGTLNQPTVQLSFNTDGTIDEQVNVPGNLRVARSTGNSGPWTNAGGAGAYSPAAPRGYTISAPTPIDATSYFALASTNAVDNPLTGVAPLPVTLTRFTATKQGSAVRLDWATASEKNSAYFAVERAGQSTQFAEISRVAAQHNSATNHSYAVVDAAPLLGLNYYRLRQVDLDGTVAYSPVATVHFAGPALHPELTSYPNPVETAQGVHLVATGLAAEGATVRIHDSLGRLIATQQVASGNNETILQPSPALKAGLYFISWQATGGILLTTKVVVK